MTVEGPLISVVMPVHNGVAFLDNAVATLLAQTRPPDEVILVDDGSTDDTAKLAAALSPPFRLVCQERQGPSAARNRGLREARGDIIAFLDVDDLWPADKLAVQGAVLDEESDVDVVQGLVRILPIPEESLPPKLLTPHFHVNLGAGLYRRRVFDEVGAFDTSMRYGEDFDWMLRVHEAGRRFRWIHRITLFYRRHPDAMTWGRDRTELGVFQVIKQSLDRRRKAGTRPAAPLSAIAPASSGPDPGEPRVSVIVPAFNSERFIAAALASIEAQTFVPSEVIVVDDGSTDGTSDIAAGFPGVTLLRQAHVGVAAARNRGLEVATGEVVAWLDADDLWPPGALAAQAAVLGGAEGPALVLGRTREFRESGHSDINRLETEAGPATGGELPGVTVGSREIYERVGPLSKDLRVGAFMDWFLRAKETGERILTHDRVVLFRRLHDDNLGLRERDARRDYLEVVKARLRRRRSAGERGEDG